MTSNLHLLLNILPPHLGSSAFYSASTLPSLFLFTLSLVVMTYFRITLIRSAIGLPENSTNVLKALGLRKRMSTVFHQVSPSVAGQIMKVKELVAVSEVERPLTKAQVHKSRKPDPGFYIETVAHQQRDDYN